MQAAERLARLIEPVHDRALAFARCLCRSRADGDDLYQEALLRALTKLDALRDDAAFRPWLYRIVITVHRNRARRAFWRRLLPLGDPAVAEDAAGAQPGILDYRTSDWSPDAAGASERARTALAVLPAVQREAIVLFELEDWLVDEIAALQRVSASAVKSRLARAGPGCVRTTSGGSPPRQCPPSSQEMRHDPCRPDRHRRPRRARRRQPAPAALGPGCAARSARRGPP